RASGRRHLLQLIEQLWDLSTRYAHLQLHMVPDRATEALYEIRSIIAACRRKDADAVGLMIRYKVHQTTTGLLQHMSLPEPVREVARVVEEGAEPSKTKKAKKAGPQAKAKRPVKAAPIKAKAPIKTKTKAQTTSPTKATSIAKKGKAKVRGKSKAKTVRKG